MFFSYLYVRVDGGELGHGELLQAAALQRLPDEGGGADRVGRPVAHRVALHRPPLLIALLVLLDLPQHLLRRLDRLPRLAAAPGLEDELVHVEVGGHQVVLLPQLPRRRLGHRPGGPLVAGRRVAADLGSHRLRVGRWAALVQLLDQSMGIMLPKLPVRVHHTWAAVTPPVLEPRPDTRLGLRPSSTSRLES